MKRFATAIAFVTFISILFICCNQRSSNYEEDILGTWQMDSMNHHFEGEDNLVRLDNSENLWLGSITNPTCVQFAPFNEAYVFGKQFPKKRDLLSTYKIIGDSIIYKSYDHQRILLLNEENLITSQEGSIDYFDKSVEHPIDLFTIYYHRVKDDE